MGLRGPLSKVDAAAWQELARAARLPRPERKRAYCAIADRCGVSLRRIVNLATHIRYPLGIARSDARKPRRRAGEPA